jgi:hypothetical protein
VTPHCTVDVSTTSSVPEQPATGPKLALNVSDGQCGAVQGMQRVLFLEEQGTAAKLPMGHLAHCVQICTMLGGLHPLVS